MDKESSKMKVSNVILKMNYLYFFNISLTTAFSLELVIVLIDFYKNYNQNKYNYIYYITIFVLLGNRRFSNALIKKDMDKISVLVP